MTNLLCHCGSEQLFESCCLLYLNGSQKAPTALALMRSRYTAYVVQNADYLIETTHSSTRKLFSKDEILNWSQQNKWLQLEVLATTDNTVTFNAHFLDTNRIKQIHFEHSYFKKEDDNWYYVEGEY